MGISGGLMILFICLEDHLSMKPDKKSETLQKITVALCFICLVALIIFTAAYWSGQPSGTSEW